MSSLRVLVVDDSVVYRRLVSDLLSTLPNVEVVGTASNGRVALTRLEELTPDLITLDIEMPEMDGLALLEELRRRNIDVGVLMVSSHTVRGGVDDTGVGVGGVRFRYQARTRGPGGQSRVPHGVSQGDPDSLCGAKADSRHSAQYPAPGGGAVAAGHLCYPWASGSLVCPLRPFRFTISAQRELGAHRRFDRWPNALALVVPALPADLTAPVVIVQHMPETFTRSLASSLDAKSPLRVKEADDGETLQGGTVYIAPGGRQMRLVETAGRRIVQITDDPRSKTASHPWTTCSGRYHITRSGLSWA